MNHLLNKSLKMINSCTTESHFEVAKSYINLVKRTNKISEYHQNLLDANLHLKYTLFKGQRDYL